MEKRGLLIGILISVLFISAVWFIPSLTGFAINDTVDQALRPLGSIAPGEDFYTKEKYGYIIDWIIFLIIFTSISKKFLGERMGNRTANALGVLLAFGLAFAESRMNFFFGDLGPFIFMFAVAIMISLVYLAYRQYGGSFWPFAISYILGFWILNATVFNPNNSLGRSITNDNPTLASIWALFTLGALIILVMIIWKLFHKLSGGNLPKFKGFKRKSASEAQIINNSPKGPQPSNNIKPKRPSRPRGPSKASMLADIDLQAERLDNLINSIETQVSNLDAINLKNSADRYNILTQIKALIQVFFNITKDYQQVLAYTTKNSDVLARIEELKKKYVETLKRLKDYIEIFYQKLLEERKRVIDEKQLDKQEITILNEELDNELKKSEKVFRELKDEIKNVNSKELSNRLNEIVSIRNQLRKSLMDLVDLIKNQRAKNLKLLESLISQQLSLSSNFQNSIKKIEKNENVEQNINNLTRIADNLLKLMGAEINVNNSDTKINQQIINIKEPLSKYYSMVINLDKEVTEYYYRFYDRPEAQ